MDNSKIESLLTDTEIKTLRAKGNEVDQMYYIVRSFNNGVTNGYKLSVGDLLKLGRIKFFIRELCFHNNKQKSDSNILFMRDTVNSEVAVHTGYNSHHEMTCEFSCRVCLIDTFTLEDPLINPCKCRGSVAQIHIKCLKTWLNSKLQQKEGVQSTVFNYKNFECELCNTPYPKSIMQIDSNMNHTKVDLLEQDEPVMENQLVLETLNKENNLTGALHIVQFHELGNMVRIGRGSESDIRISDISVSRFHTQIKQLEDGFQVEDNSSKFGTLVRVRDGICLEKDNGLDGHAIQMGRTLLSISYIKTFNFAKMLNQLQYSKSADNENNQQPQEEEENRQEK